MSVRGLFSKQCVGGYFLGYITYLKLEWGYTPSCLV